MMKTILLLVLSVLTVPFAPAFVDNTSFLQSVDAAFVGHAKVATEFTTRGKTQIGWFSNFVEAGSFHGEHLLGLSFAYPL